MVTLLRNLRNLRPLLMQRFLLCFLLKWCNVSFRSENCPASSGVGVGSSTLTSLFQCFLLQMQSFLHWVTLALCQKLPEAAARVISGLPVLFLGPCTCHSANTAVLITVALQESSKCGGHRPGSETSSHRERDGPKPSCVYRRPLPTNADCSRSCLGRPGLV